MKKLDIKRDCNREANSYKEYWVVGGIFTDTKFNTFTGEKEEYGPFETYDAAYKTWNSKSWSTVDICCARYKIEEKIL